MKKKVLIILAIIVVLFVLMVFLGYTLEKKEIKEVTPDFEKKYEEALLVYKSDEEKGIEVMENVMYYGHSHGLKAYKDFLVIGFTEYYREGLNLLARHYKEQGKMLADEGKFDEALEMYKKIYNYTDKSDETVTYKKGPDVDLLFIEIKKLKTEN